MTKEILTSMKILMINFEFPPIGGGSGNANFYLLKEFSKYSNLKIDLITANQIRKNKIEDFSKNIKIHKIGIKKEDLHHWKATEMAEWCIKSYFYIKQLLKENKYDLCFCWNGWPPGFLGYLFRKKVPYMIALRGHDVPGYEIRFKNLEKFFLKNLSKKVWENAKIVTSNSDKLKELARETSNVPIKVIYNGIDTKEFKPKSKKLEKKIVLITTGRLGQRKGHIYLIKALQKIDGFKLIVIGDGIEKEKLVSESKGLDIELKGYVKHEELPKELQKADAFISTALVEGMSNSTLEAMACGLPIITTDVGGAKELINGNGTIISKTQDINSIVQVLNKYKNSPKLLKKQGIQSRKIAEKMSWENVAKEYEGVMKK
jgi:glycosyltransferase involved in cell wall biosynthesis